MADLAKLNLQDLKDLDLGDLKKLQALLGEAEEGKREEAFAKTCATVQQTIDESPFTVEEVVQALTGKVKKKVLPKYRNTENAEQTWTGRGRKPGWLVAALESGTKIETFLIEHEKQENLL